MTIPSHEELPHYCYAEYVCWKGDWELIGGIPYAMTPAPSIKHQIISNNIAWQLKDLLQGCPKCQALLPVDWKIDESTIVQPDNLVICDAPENEAFLTKAPMLIFEVLSKSTASKDRTTKFHLYEREGVQYYVIVDPDNADPDNSSAKIYGLLDGRYVKIKDVSSEPVGFDFDECSIVFDFSKIWT